MAVLEVVAGEVSQVELTGELVTHHLRHRHKEAMAVAVVVIAAAAVVVQVPLERLLVVVPAAMEVTEPHLASAVHP